MFLTYNIIIWPLILYMFIRGLWFCKERLKFARKASRLLKENIRRNKYLKQIEYDTDSLRYFDETLWSYNKTYFHFWILDFKKMVYNKEAFEEVVKFAEESEKNVLPFKKRDIKNQEDQNVSSNKK